MRLHDGGTLYDDVFFVFPPGHLLSAWIAYALDPPGVRYIPLAECTKDIKTVPLDCDVMLTARDLGTCFGD